MNGHEVPLFALATFFVFFSGVAALMVVGYLRLSRASALPTRWRLPYWILIPSFGVGALILAAWALGPFATDFDGFTTRNLFKCMAYPVLAVSLTMVVFASDILSAGAAVKKKGKPVDETHVPKLLEVAELVIMGVVGALGSLALIVME